MWPRPIPSRCGSHSQPRDAFKSSPLQRFEFLSDRLYSVFEQTICFVQSGGGAFSDTDIDVAYLGIIWTKQKLRINS